MYIKDNRKVIVGLGIVISFALLIFSISLYYTYQHEIRTGSKLSSESVESMSNEEIIEFLEERRNTEPIFHSVLLNYLYPGVLSFEQRAVAGLYLELH